MTTDMERNKKLSPAVTELFIKSRKLKVSFGFTSQFYFEVHKDVRLNAKHFTMKIPKRKYFNK